jgi:hypothetical protein
MRQKVAKSIRKMARRLCAVQNTPDKVNEHYKILKRAYKLGKKQI